MKTVRWFYGAFLILFQNPIPHASLAVGQQTFEAATARIAWDNGSLKKISRDGAAFYPRMIQLKNGSLLVAYASGGNIVAQKSDDGGRQWHQPIVIAEKQNGINEDTPSLLQLQNGELLVCYSSRPQGAMKGHPEEGKNFDIRIKKSNDNGATWGFEKVLYKAGIAATEGCWEPAAVQLPSGEIQLFFSNEAPYTHSNEQNISMLRSRDGGKTWTQNPQIISFRKGSRDGMPVPLWLAKQNRLAVAIEDPGIVNFKPYVIRSDRGGVWKNVISGTAKNRTYALRDKPADSVYAGAPYLAQLSTGETLLSFQSTEGRAGNKDYNAVMIVAIGDAEAKNFGAKTFPFDVPEGRNALWNSLCVMKGDTLIAVTSTNAFSNSTSEIWMIKGVLKH